MQVELKAAMDFDKPVIMCCGSAKLNPQTGCYEFVDDHDSLERLEWMVDVEQAQASDPVDRERIIGQINATCGAQALNDNVSASISGSVAASAEVLVYPKVVAAIQVALCGEPEQLEEIPGEALVAAVRVAASMNAVEPLRYFLSRGAPVDVPDSAGFTALMDAARAGCHRIVPVLIGAGADIHAEIEGETALYFAADAGRTTAVQALLVAGADVNQPRNNGWTPLLISAWNGHSETTKLLLAARADVNQPDNDGGTPLYISAQRGHSETTKLLLAAGANVNQARNNGSTPLYISAQKGHSETTKLLLAAGADVNQPRNDGCTPLFFAAMNGHKDVVVALLAADADKNIETKWGTAEDTARRNGHHEIVALLTK
eukprot:SAG31_NODE_2283_length_6016_cov_17.773872_2_plen_374_part_00